jgi:hypothetical protein
MLGLRGYLGRWSGEMAVIFDEVRLPFVCCGPLVDRGVLDSVGITRRFAAVAVVYYLRLHALNRQRSFALVVGFLRRALSSASGLTTATFLIEDDFRFVRHLLRIPLRLVASGRRHVFLRLLAVRLGNMGNLLPLQLHVLDHIILRHLCRLLQHAFGSRRLGLSVRLRFLFARCRLLPFASDEAADDDDDENSCDDTADDDYDESGAGGGRGGRGIGRGESLGLDAVTGERVGAEGVDTLEAAADAVVDCRRVAGGRSSAVDDQRPGLQRKNAYQISIDHKLASEGSIDVIHECLEVGSEIGGRDSGRYPQSEHKGHILSRHAPEAAQHISRRTGSTPVGPQRTGQAQPRALHAPAHIVQTTQIVLPLLQKEPLIAKEAVLAIRTQSTVSPARHTIVVTPRGQIVPLRTVVAFGQSQVGCSRNVHGGVQGVIGATVTGGGAEVAQALVGEVGEGTELADGLGGAGKSRHAAGVEERVPAQTLAT